MVFGRAWPPKRDVGSSTRVAPKTERNSAPEPTIKTAAVSYDATPVSLETLKKRADFVRIAHGSKIVTQGFVLQARERTAADVMGTIRVGFTCSRKVGNAVVRNHARRRLREAARLTLPSHGRPGWDYVLIGRARTTSTLPFPRLLADLQRAVSRSNTADVASSS